MSQFSIRFKILVMVLIPVVGLIYASVTNVLAKRSQLEGIESVALLAELAVRTSSLVHETQKERGATAGFLGSKGTRFIEELPAQRRSTDERLAIYRAYLADFDSSRFGSHFRSLLNDANSRLARLDRMRSSVTAQQIAAGEAIGYYTALNGTLLSMISTMTELTDQGAVVRRVAAYVNFLQGKERAGIERAVLSNTFARDQFGPGMYRRFAALVTEQATYARVFESLADELAKNAYNETMRGAVVDKVERMRETAFEKAGEGGFGIDAVDWFKSQTAKINLLKQVEDTLSSALIDHVSQLASLARSAMLFTLGLSLLLILLALVVSLIITTSVVGAVRRAVDALRDIADGEGDLTRRLDDQGRDEIAQLAAAFNRFAEKMRGMLLEIREAAESIATSSSEIAHGNLDLSQRTEEQAASLEETASSMEQMTSTVRNNAANAGQANQLASATRNQAVEGGETVQGAVAAMDGITRSSHQIADIIGVIDEIAFQTNLLALNAAVEAARAGDQGRGFAVVAGEVRKLAQRSAESARQITSLIRDSVARVEEGSRLVNQSGTLLHEITKGVKEVEATIAEIAAASAEQSHGIDQVNKAIAQMDEVTQQNAALVEQAAAASKSMEEQAGLLRSQVGFFRLE